MLNSRSYWASRHFPLLKPEGEGGGSGSGSGTESESKSGEGDKSKTEESKNEGGEGDDLDKIEGLGDKGREAIRKEREAAKAAAEDAKKAKEERDALLKEKSEREEAEQKAKDDAAKESGKWEELATKREGELKSAKTEAASLKAENDQLKAAVTAILDTEWKELPAEVTDAYLGAEDDPLARLAFLPKGKTLAAKLADKQSTARGNGRDPKSTGSGKPNDEAARKAQSRLYATNF